MTQRTIKLTLTLALLACTSLAQAQWVWVNEKGVKQLSDQPPPPNVPLKNILKAPRGQTMPTSTPSEEAASAPAQEAKAPPPKPTLAERNADFKKRQLEAAEAESKAKDEANRKAEKERYCAGVKQNMGALESGARISEFGAGGERNFISDEERARRLKENRDAFNKACK